METAAELNDSGIVLTEANRPSEAIVFFRRALILEPENPLLWLNLAIAQHQRGDYDEAEYCLERCRAIDDRLADAWARLGLLMYEQDRFDEAESCYHAALIRDPKLYRCWNNLGVLYFQEGSYDEARECFEQAISLNPWYYDAVCNLRDCCLELEDQRAAHEFSRLLLTMSARHHPVKGLC